jgi:hypothetical protein
VAANTHDVLVALAIGATVTTIGCARTTDAEVQSAFEAAQRGEASNPRAHTRGRGKRPTASTVARDPWAAVQAKLAEAIAVFGDVADAATFDTLAQRWCEVRPEPTETEDGRTYLCYPEPPLRVEGRAFTLELSASGVIGLQTDDLNGAESRQLADRAREAVTRFCATPWTALRQDEPGPRAQQFHTCPSDGGVTLAVGRFPVGSGGDRWRVSLSVLGST